MVYIALTRLSAKRILWKALKEIAMQNGIKNELKFNNTELTVEFPNGSQIFLTGAQDENDIEVLRGSKYSLVVVDECASFKSHFATMVEEVIEPALVDLDGVLALIGTPGAACTGYFYDACTSSESPWAKHHWTILDNPHIPNAMPWLQRRMMQHGWTSSHPVYQREWLGRWVKSQDSLVYQFNRALNVVDVVDPAGMTFVLGIDLGWDDQTAFCVIGFTDKSPNVYVFETYAKSKMLVDDIAAKIKALQKQYNGFRKIVADTGGLGKSICEEIKARHGLHIYAAEKAGKLAFIDVVNSDFVSGKIKIPKTEYNLIEEMELLQWDSESRHKRIEDPRFSNHRCFVAGTKIATPEGLKPIETLRIGDVVLTETGCYPIYSVMASEANTVVLKLSDGREIVTTANHPFKVGDAWTRADQLKGSVLTTRCFSFAQGNVILKGLSKAQSRLATFIERCGSFISDLFPKVLLSTTKIETKQTTRLKISVSCPEQSMIENIERKDLRLETDLKILKTLSESEKKRKNGTKALKVCNGIENTTKETRAHLKNQILSHVRFVAKLISNRPTKTTTMVAVATNVLPQNVERTARTISNECAIAGKNSSSTNIVKQNHVRVLAVEISKRQTVYNISVAVDPTYFVEDILVSNCDAMIYSIREAKHYLYKAPEVAPKVGSEAHFAAQEKALLEKVTKQFTQQNQWWET